MAFTHGKSTVFLMNEYNLSSYLNQASTSGTVETAETTAFGNSSKTYITGLSDASISASGMFDGATGAIDDAMTASLGATSSVVSYFPEGTVVGKRSRMAACHLTSYEVSSPVGDVVAVSTEFQVTGGLKAGVSLRDISSAITTTANGTSVDNGSSSTSTAGQLAVGHLHVTANSLDNTLVVKIQHSTDNSTFADLITFSTVSTGAETSVRSEVSAGTTVNRYVRATFTTSATSGSATVGVAFAR